MITKEEIKNLADLARVNIDPAELDTLSGEIGSILGYIDQINTISATVEKSVPSHRNIMRDDIVTNSTGEHTENILSNSPSREKNYLKVKKIL
jgi:aspartyl-tRNA(Asn)/glutamyl-tRNA(Gln) amidotransferase subunit C